MVCVDAGGRLADVDAVMCTALQARFGLGYSERALVSLGIFERPMSTSLLD